MLRERLALDLYVADCARADVDPVALGEALRGVEA
jgi:hypothetical protein